MLDYLIVGQGTAGTCLAYQLLKQGKSLKIIDNNHVNSSSMVAAGIINPITGRKYVKSWMIDQLLPYAAHFYMEIGKDLGIDILKKTGVIRTLPDIKSENNWWARQDTEGYEDYLKTSPDIGPYSEMIALPFVYGEIVNALRIDLPKLLSSFRLAHSEKIIAEQFNFSELRISEDYINYRHYEAKKIIFCEGYKVLENPFFNNIPIEPAKGEILLVKIDGIVPKKILRHNIFLCPLEDNIYWVGSGYDWEIFNETPTEEEKERLVKVLQNLLKVPFTIVDHKAGVRPSSRDRRPCIGQHFEKSQVYMFNGMGTKGASLAPFWSEKLADYLSGLASLPEEVDIKRFQKELNSKV